MERKKNILILLLEISNQRQNITCVQWICQTSRQYYESSPICRTNHSWCETWRQASKQEASKTHVFVEFVIEFCLLEVMEVVELRGEVKREVVTTVVVHHLQMKMCSKKWDYSNLKLNHAEPEPSNWQGSPHEQNPRTH